LQAHILQFCYSISEKDASPPKGRKKLDFRTPSPANCRPLTGKTIYLDLKNFRGQRSVENDLILLGAVSMLNNI
jgi:hypothetical protein